MRGMLPFSLGIVFASLGAPLPHAQQAEAPLPPSEECEVSPLDEAPPAADSLTDALAPCDGVLAPAPVGDEEMTITPPAMGETPVIPPEEVPPQPAEPD